MKDLTSLLFGEYAGAHHIFAALERDRVVIELGSAAMSALINVNDLRTYGSAILILNDLHIRRVRLITNNPNKQFVLEENGIEVVETVGSIVTRPDLRQYLKTKREEGGTSLTLI